MSTELSFSPIIRSKSYSQKRQNSFVPLLRRIRSVQPALLVKNKSLSKKHKSETPTKLQRAKSAVIFSNIENISPVSINRIRSIGYPLSRRITNRKSSLRETSKYRGINIFEEINKSLKKIMFRYILNMFISYMIEIVLNPY